MPKHYKPETQIKQQARVLKQPVMGYNQSRQSGGKNRR